MRETRRKFVLALAAAASCLPRRKRCYSRSGAGLFQTRQSRLRRRIRPVPSRKPPATCPQENFCRRMSVNFAPASSASINSPVSCATRCKRRSARCSLRPDIQEDRANRETRQATEKQSQKLADPIKKHSCPRHNILFSNAVWEHGGFGNGSAAIGNGMHFGAKL